MFAKLYETDIGQILVKLDSNDDCAPEIRFYFEPTGLGVCSVAAVFESDDDGWNKAEKNFESITQDKAEEVVNNAMSEMPFLKAE